MGKTWVHNTGNSISIPPAHTRGRFKLGLNVRVRHSVNSINIFRPNMLEGHACKSERASPAWQVLWNVCVPVTIWILEQSLLKHDSLF